MPIPWSLMRSLMEFVKLVAETVIVDFGGLNLMALSKIITKA